jgi:hypothetical protein
LVAFCLRHFSADFIICMCEFDFRQAQVARTDTLQDAAIPVTTSASARAPVVRASRKKLSRPPKLVGPVSIGEAR